MSDYKPNKLKNYIENSKLIIVKDYFKICLSNELFQTKYEMGLYDDGIKFLLSCINKIFDIELKYPSNAKLVFYVYIVPDHNFVELLNYPKNHIKAGGGRSVACYHLDGFPSAFGISNNLIENFSKAGIMKEVNIIHEFSHLVSSIFFSKDRFISEGFAECLPLYTLEYENYFIEYQKALNSLKEEDILSANELIMIQNTNFNGDSIIPNKSCSFDIGYISSFLFMKVCLEEIRVKFNLNKVQATQKLLEFIRSSRYTNQYLIYDIADFIDVSREELLYGKKRQIEIIKK